LELKEKIDSKKAVIAVVGLGYVGLPLAVQYAMAGFKTFGIDTDRKKVDRVNRGENYIRDVQNAHLEYVVRSGVFQASTTYDSVAESDVVFICVPTPFTEAKDPDITYILSASREIKGRLHKGQLIVLKSTTFPSTTEEYVQPVLEESGLKGGRDFHLAFSPERIDPGNKQFTIHNTPIVVGGLTPACTEAAVAITRQVIAKVVPVSSPRIAEMEKLLENIFRSVNIALVNEMAQLCDRMGGIDVWEVVEAAATKPFGFMPFYPGPGIGGHCILIDPYYLSWLARKYDFQTNFIALAAETNENMPFFVKDKVMWEIAHLPVGLAEARILLLGAAFKKDVDDTRHSPAMKVFELLLLAGARNIMYHDPYVQEMEICGERFASVALTPEELRKTTCVIILTDHSQFDYRMIGENASLIIDTRNAMKRAQPVRARVVKLGGGHAVGKSNSVRSGRVS
jgi:UDP-N-acetyl-D-glucosamine dehydrogenase